ncbi:MAG TPA: fused MFS/spermidine synthase [Polyangia bacterium]
MRARVSAAIALVWALGVAGCAHQAEPAVPSPSPPSAPTVVFDQTSAFGRVLVRDEGPLRVMRFGSPPGSEQSEIVRDRPDAVPMEYVQLALLGLGHVAAPKRVLMVGLGGGTFTTLLHRLRPEITIDAVEIDPVVVAAARACFALREDDRYRVHVADAAAWLARDQPGAEARYDYVVLDAYAGEDIPAAIGSPAFFESVRAHLAPGGVVALNVAEADGQGAPVAVTFARVLSVFERRRAPRDGNLLLYAAAEPRATPALDAVLRFAAAWDARGLTDFSMRALAVASRCCGDGRP